MTLRTFSADEIDAVGGGIGKFGLSSSSSFCSVLWRLPTGDNLVVHQHPYTDSVITVLSGQGVFKDYGTRLLDESSCYIPRANEFVLPPPEAALRPVSEQSVSAGGVVMVPAGRYFGVVNTAPIKLTLVYCTSALLEDTSWTTRPGTAIARTDG